MDMEYLVMNYSDEEDVFPSEDGAESHHFTSRTPNLADDAMEEDMEILDSPVKTLRTFGFLGARSPFDLKGVSDNTNESSINQIEDDDNTIVISDEDDSDDVISPIIISNVESTRQSLTHHMMMTHKIKFQEGSLSTEAQQLKSCDLATICQHLGKHRQLHTLKNEPIVSCTKCDYKVPCITPCFHYRNVHESPMNKQEKAKQLYTCKFCSYTTEYEDYFENHLLLHTEEYSSLAGREADLETSIDLDKCQNYSVLSPKSEREDEESDKENSAATTLPISFSSLVGQEADTASAIDLDSSKSHTVSLIKDEEDEGINKETAAAANFPISSSFLVGQEADLETSIDLDKYENFKSQRDEESNKENCTAPNLPISFACLIGQDAYTATAIDLDRSKSHNVSLIKDEEDEQIDKGNSTGATSLISLIPLVGHKADTEAVVGSDNGENPLVSTISSDKEDEESDNGNSTLSISTRSGADTVTAMDSDNTERYSESPLTDKQDEKSENRNSSASVVRNPMNSTDESSESQGARSRKFEANSCDTSTNSQKYQDKPVISDRTTFKCEVCSYSSTIRFRLKRHMLSHSENSDLNKIKCAHCLFETKSKKSLYNHWLVTHNKTSRCTICDTFVPAHLKQKHFLKCKPKKNVFECKECQYKTLNERMFVRHQIDCSNKRHSISSAETQQLKSCNFCSYATKNERDLEMHVILHTVHNMLIYHCPKCEYKSTKNKLTRHVKAVHKIEFFYLAKTKLWKCDFCSFTTTSNQQLKVHRQLHTVRKESIVSCTKCDYKAPQVTLTYHYKNVHRSDNPHRLIKITEYTCKFCSFTTNDGSVLRRHTHLHTVHNRPIYCCPVGHKENEESDKETPRATNFPISSSSLGEQRADMEAEIDLDECENHGTYSPNSRREGEESGKDNSTAEALPISLSSLVGQEANMAEDNCKSHNAALIKGEEQIDKGNSTAIISPISSIPLVGLDADMETMDSDNDENPSVSSISSDKEDEESNKGNLIAATLPISNRSEADTIAAMDWDNTESPSESPLTDEQDKKCEKQNSSVVVRNIVNSTDESSESQGERSRQFVASGCNTSTNLQKYHDKPVISDRTTFKRKRYSYTSTIRFGLKRHMLSHFENSDLNKIKCQLCPFEAKSKKSLSNHWLVTHKNEKSKRTICDTFVPAHLKKDHLLKCKAKRNILECKECQYKTIYEWMFVGHQMECSNKGHSIPRQSEVPPGDQNSKSEKSEQREKINKRSKRINRCEYCSYSTIYINHFKGHLLAHTVSNSPIYRCPKCDYKSTRKSLTHHMMIAHKIKFREGNLSTEAQRVLISCDFCSYTTKYSHHLRKHRQLHTVRNEPIVSCNKCDYKAPRITILFHYMNVHGSQFTEMQYPCKFCSYIAHTSSSLNNHTRLHTVYNRPIYRCPKCEYKSTTYNLTRHVKVVHKIKFGDLGKTKEFKCDFCSFTTKSNHKLKRHRQLHTVKNKPIISCTKCDYKAPRATLFYHYNNVHGSPMNEQEKATQVYTCNSENHCALPSIGDKENEENDIETPRATNFPISSSSLGEQGADMEAEIDLDKVENHGIFSSKSKREDEERYKENSTAATFPILSNYSLVGQEVNTSAAVDLDNCKSPNVALIKDEKVEQIDKGNPAAIISPISSIPLFGLHADMGTVVDSDNTEGHSEPPLIDKQDKKSEKQNVSAVVRNSVNGTDVNSTGLKKCDFCSYTTKYSHHLGKHRQLHTVWKERIVSCTKCDYKAPRATLFYHYKNVHGSPMNKQEKAKNEVEQIGKENSIAVISPISTALLVGPDADMETMVDSDNGENPSVSSISSYKEDEESDKGNSIAATLPISTMSGADTVSALDSGHSDSRSESPLTDKEDENIKVVIRAHAVSLSAEAPQLKSCNFCSYTSKFDRDIIRHHRLHIVRKEPIIICTKCDYKSTKNNFSKHVKDAHNTSSLAKTKEVKKCDFCSYTTKFNTNMIRHHQLHTVRNEPIIICTKCDYKAPRVALSHHYKNVHSPQITKEYTCKLCSHSTYNKGNLKRHIRLHTVHNNLVYRCPKCDYKSTKMNLARHVKTVHKIESKNTSSPRNQNEDHDNNEVVSDEGDSKDVISSTSLSRVGTMVDDEDYYKSSAKATSPTSPPFVEDGTNTETSMDFDNSQYHSNKTDEESDRENDENDAETPAAVFFPISSSSLVEQEANLETSIDLFKCENHSILSPKSEREDEESDKANSTAVTLPISFNSLVGGEANTARAMALESSKSHKVSLIKDEEDEESDQGNSTAATLPISSSSLGRQEADLEMEVDLDKHENHSILSPKNEREDKESDKENSTAAISFGSLVEQEAKAAKAIDLDISKNHNISLIEDKADEQVDKESSTAVLVPILSIPLVRLEADIKTVVDLDNSENHSVSPLSSDNEDEESNEKTSDAATPISTKSLVGYGADRKTAMDSNNSNTEHEIGNKKNIIAATSPISSRPLLGRGTATEKAMDPDNSESSSESLITGPENEESVKESSIAVVRNPVNSTDELSESQGKSSRQFEAHGCDTLGGTPTNSQKYQDNPVIPDRTTFKCKLCSYSSTIRFGLKRHMMTHFEDLGFNKTKCKFVPSPILSIPLVRLEADIKTVVDSANSESHSVSPLSSDNEDEESNEKNSDAATPISTKSLVGHGADTKTAMDSKQRLTTHLLVRHKNEKSKCNICDTFVSAHLKEKHLLECKTEKKKFECKECQYRTIYARMFVRHQKECGNKRHSIPCQSEASGEQCGTFEKTKQRGEINEPSNPHRCDHCSYSTKLKAHFKKHMIAHIVSNSPMYRCSECDYKSTRRNLTRHMMLAHNLSAESQQLKRCNFCSHTSHEGKSHFEAHLRLHTVHNRPIYQCPKCDYKSTNLNFARHVKSAHRVESKNISSLSKKEVKKCDFCSYTTEYNRQLKSHREMHTVRNEPIDSCTKCDYKAPRVTLFFHYVTVHGSLMNKIKQCTFCSYTSNYENNWKRHVLLHTAHNRPIYHCPKCDYKSIKLNLAKHMMKVHKIQYKKCKLKKTHTGKEAIALRKKSTRGATTQDVQKWSKQSTNKTNGDEGEQTLEQSQKLLVSNTKTRQRCPEYSCELCSFTTKFEANLNRHLRIHRVQNEQCNKSIEVHETRHSHTQKQEQRISKQLNSKDVSTSGIEIEGRGTLKRPKKLLSMIKTREQLEQPYICDFCSFTTKFKPSLIRHLGVHAERNKRIYSCSQCDYKATKLALRQHLRIHRGEQTIVPERESARRASPEDTQRAVLNSRKLSNEIDTSDNEGEEFAGQSEKILSTTRTNEELSDLEYGCDLCSFTTHFEHNLDKHLNLHGVQNEQTYSGSRCEYKSTKVQLQNVTTHSRIVHREKLVSEHQNRETKVKNYRCQLCSFTTKMADAFEQHGHSHKGSRTLKTDMLSKKRRSEYWKNPAETANKRLSGNKLPELHSSCDSSESFQVAHGDNNIIYVCEICDYTTNHKQNLTSHKLAHLSRKTLKAKRLSSAQASSRARATPTYSKASAKKRCF